MIFERETRDSFFQGGALIFFKVGNGIVLFKGPREVLFKTTMGEFPLEVLLRKPALSGKPSFVWRLVSEEEVLKHKGLTWHCAIYLKDLAPLFFVCAFHLIFPSGKVSASGKIIFE